MDVPRKRTSESRLRSNDFRYRSNFCTPKRPITQSNVRIRTSKPSPSRARIYELLAARGQLDIVHLSTLAEFAVQHVGIGRYVGGDWDIPRLPSFSNRKACTNRAKCFDHHIRLSGSRE